MVPSAGKDFLETDSFAGLGLTQASLQGAADAGFVVPTDVQATAIPPMLAGRDVVVQAQTGTGKTAAYALPILDTVDAALNAPQALVLCPTRELAVQVATAVGVLSRPAGIRVAALYGGQPIGIQARALSEGAPVVVGTPGRLLDHLRRGTLKPEHIRAVVIDEADEMLAMGFIEEVEGILDAVPAERQTALFSATMPAPILRLAGTYLRAYERVGGEGAAAPVAKIRHRCYEVPAGRKPEALARLLDYERPECVIAFSRTRRDAQELSDYLARLGHPAEALHGEMAQGERDRVMVRFREGLVSVLVATDLAARGLDIEAVSHVVNVDLPWGPEEYTHRVGRTGRAGRSGEALTLVGPRDRFRLRQIEKGAGVRFTAAQIPTDREIARGFRRRFEEKVASTTSAEGLEPFLMAVRDLSANSSPEQIAAAALKLLWETRNPTAGGTPIAYEYERPAVANQDGDFELREGRRSRAAKVGGADSTPTRGHEMPTHPPRTEAMTRIRVSVGRRDAIKRKDLTGVLLARAGMEREQIRGIEIGEDATVFAVPDEAVRRVMEVLLSARVRGRELKAETLAPSHTLLGGPRSLEPPIPSTRTAKRKAGHTPRQERRKSGGR
jgi:ATP-dependent RNA helicase DeaD